MYKYNYVLFNSPDKNKLRANENGYYTICTKELESSSEIKLVSYPLDYKPFLVRLMFRIHNSAKVEQYIHLPFKTKWYPFYFNNDFEDRNKPICFILLNRYLPISYLHYLKATYHDCRIVLLHRDLVKICNHDAPGLSGNSILDLEMTYDKGESVEFGWPYFSEFESKINIPIGVNFPESDVFFAGKAKDRLPLIMAAYQKITQASLKCFFYLTGVDEQNREPLPGVVYADSFMTYKEMLYHTLNSRCILEINQAGANGYTSRFLESVIYGKKLITNNVFIKESPFFSPDRIQIVENFSDINCNFIKSGNGFVDYDYNGEFSPFRVIDRIEEELNIRYGK